jgi:carboxypeptidase Q
MTARRLALALSATALTVLWATIPVGAQEAPPAEKAATKTSTDPIALIKDEGLNRSEVMATVSYLSDVIGPRLTGSPQLKRANEWTRDTMAKWGLENAHLEAWGPFGRGWELVRYSAQVVEPQCIPLIAFPKAWSSGLESPLIAEVVLFDPKTEAEVDSFQGKLGGKIVLASSPREVKAWFEPPATRQTDGDLLRLANAPEPGARGAGGGPPFRRGGPQGGGPPGFDPSQLAVRRKKAELLNQESPAVIVEASPRGDGGTLFVQQASANPGSFTRGGKPVWDKNGAKLVPQLVMAIEHYNRLVRMLQQGEPVKMAVDLAVKYHDDDPMAYNTVAEIPGTDKKEEVVMLGGHMDSWHSGTGATDNAAGVAVAMEAARILKKLDLKPRRTIRVALWTGEEQGLLGSRAYVKQHFGSNEEDPLSAQAAQWVGGQPKRTFQPGPEYDYLAAYFNLDNGTGKIRGIYIEGNEALRPIFRRWLAPFGDLGASTITSSRTGGTDHMSFDAIGLPGFQFIQDQVEYNTRTHHSNQDVYDRLQADDLKQASVIMAAFVYNAAMADEKLPRKPRPER